MDFWPGFIPEKSLFYRILSRNYKIKLSENPEFLIYSCFGYDHLKYKCLKLFYTGENRSSNFQFCDFSISFEKLRNPRQYFLPLFGLVILEDNLLERLTNPSINLFAKSKFCAQVVSNPKADFRNNFFKELNNCKRVDSGGKFQNNIGRIIKNKLKFIEPYRFVLAFENESHKGYLTEKVLDALLVGAIPIYWGDTSIEMYLNPKRFINRHNFKSNSDCIEEVLRIENDTELYAKMSNEPVFLELPSFLDVKALEDFILEAVKSNKKPIAKTFKGKFAYLKIYLKLKKSSFKRELSFLLRALSNFFI
ncbi:glycosyltransferase family 10 domain-containing protein [Leeuwenhoekiella parthenopeia]|uniref:Glycosyltransferase family 10 n=1 Tax=Leeuwenhoekiella parthenopeia TaxID=2890320 RepID=A0ABS8H1F5_9FLAO|nr:glycosyltransferase family 10 [Leeuwenhoekiella parthenopeia]